MKNFIVYQNGKIKRVVIYKIEKKKLDSLIDTLKKIEKCEIVFLNIQTIPLALLEVLERKKRDIVKMEVNEKRLSHYLRRLGFANLFSREKERDEAKEDAIFPTVIAIGGSAGSVEKIAEILKSLPPSMSSLFIIIHQKRDAQNTIAGILQKYTKHYTVVTALDNQKVKPSYIYVAPSNYQMTVVDGYILLDSKGEQNFARPSISVTFESLAKEYEEHLITVLVCGYGKDGSDALGVVKDVGATVVIQQPYECLASPMLQNAIETRNFDYILPLEDICSYLFERLQEPYLTQEELVKFLEKIYEVYGYDFRNYDLKHIRRRVEIFFKKWQFSSFTAMIYKVLESKTLFQVMFLDLSINVSTFFRNPPTFLSLRKLLQNILHKSGPIKIWSAGCSTGEEPYSLAILLDELGVIDRAIIYATDMNEAVLEEAKNGAYAVESFEVFEKHYIESGGKREFSSYFDKYEDFVVVKQEIREKVVFFKHNLAMDGVLNEFQLIFCRNVIIYFNENLSRKVFKLFYESLEKGGVLVIGESEALKHEGFAPLDPKNKIFQKVKQDEN